MNKNNCQKRLDNNIKQLEAEFRDRVDQKADRLIVRQLESTDQAKLVSLQTEVHSKVQPYNVHQ